MKHFIAKSKPSIESIWEHTDKLLKGINEFYEFYGKNFTRSEIELIKLAAEYHDYGKSAYGFQKAIRKSANLIAEALSEDVRKPIEELYASIKDSVHLPHGYLSPAFLNLPELKELYSDTEIEVLINAIFYHHTRKYRFEDGDLRRFIKEDIAGRLPKDIVLKVKYLAKIYKDNRILSDEDWVKYAIVKGMLNKFDYWASSDETVAIEINPKQAGSSVGNLVEERLLSKYKSLRKMQLDMKKRRDENLVVIASTGMGKTEAALLWLDDAKSFYTLPLKVSINAIYERIWKEYGYQRDRVTLLHSDVMAYLIENENSKEDNPFEKYKATKGFAYPLTICTVDQMFTFVYKYRGSEMLLAILKYSKLIIDEIQAYSPDIVAKIIYGLKLITMAGGRFAIITATLPPVFEHFMKKYDIPYSKLEKYCSELRRHYIKFIDGEFDLEQIKEAGRKQKVLVLCNTVKKAQEVYKKLAVDSDVSLLHAHFTKEHRAILEKLIMKFADGKDNRPGIWVSTQIVEASLDIDFDILFTEMCPADSLLQRMGRCFRKREYTGNTPNVLIYNTGNGIGSVYPYSEIYARSVDYIKKYSGQMFTEEEKCAYIDQVFDEKELMDTSFYDEIDKSIKKCQDTVPGIFTAEEAKWKFRGILSTTVIPESVYEEANKDGRIDGLIQILSSKGTSYGQKILAKEQINRYSISLDQHSSIVRKFADVTSIGEGLDIYRIQYPYEFDEKSYKGAGLYNGEDLEIKQPMFA